ncbi:hypothetical protein WA026_006306 [Henosepilachna vigintioctopunctata]|uniref:Cilia- and flagella-associated protein 298 n=1 Tax=Henosepilachna vigintioctopunctata TaxID=420089 RepID=A0AAW1TI56_9CUCU
MVIIHVKNKDESQFLYETTLQTPVEELIKNVVAIYNGRLKIQRVCSEIQELSEHGILYPPEILGLTPEQVEEMNLKDPYEEKCIPSGGYIYNKDPIGRRNGRQPKNEMKQLLQKAVEDAKEQISKNLVPMGKLMTMKIVQEALNILKGAVTIVYPMKLPPHDVISMEFENIEDLSGTQASLDVLDPTTAQMWFCGKEMFRDKVVEDYVGKIENCKVIMKLSKKGSGPPAREPIMNEQDRKEMMMHAYRKQEEMKKLHADDDDSYLNSQWADGSNMKKSFHGLSNITWRPGGRRTT